MSNLILSKRKTNQITLLFSIIVVLTSFSTYLKAQANPSIFDIMQHTTVLDLTITTDLDALKNNRRSAEKYLAIIQFKDEHQQVQEWATNVSIRGNFRRMKCAEIPPLKLDFKKKDLIAAGLAKFDDYKLVTHCVEESKQAKELVLKEYLAYKLYNGITDHSFRVQLLNITFIDQKTGDKIKQSGFLIEDTAELRNRIGAEKVKEKINVPYAQFNSAQVRQVALFQYFIGNSDWDLSVSRNVKYVLKADQILAIPYDFDFSGLVDAPYALVANPKLGIHSIKERVYLGFNEDPQMLKESIELLKSKKSTLQQIVKDFKPLKGKARREMLTYLNTFFDNVKVLKMPEVKLLAGKLGD